MRIWSIAAGALAFWFLGAIWYGVVFTDAWIAAINASAADMQSESPIWMLLGALIPIITMIVLSLVLNIGGRPDLKEALQRTVLLWLGFGLTAALYPLAYEPEHSVTLAAINGGYTLFGWLAGAAIMTFVNARFGTA